MSNDRGGAITIAFDGESDVALQTLRELVSPEYLPSRHERVFEGVDSSTFHGQIKAGSRSVSAEIVVVDGTGYIEADYFITSGRLRRGRRFTTNPNQVAPWSPIRTSTNATCLVIDYPRSSTAVARNAANHLVHLILARCDSRQPASKIENTAWLLR